MRSAVIPSALSYPAVRLAPQPVHQRCVPPGPLVLGRAPRKSRTPTADRDRTVSRRSKPSSRTALNGEQPYPWDLLQPQDAMSRHRGAKRRRRYGLLGVISLLSPAYLLSVERWPFHTEPPDHFDLLSHLLDLSVSQSSTLLPMHIEARFPTVLSVPSYSSVTLWEDTAPVKLTGCHCPQPRSWDQVRFSNCKGWCFIVDSVRSENRISQSPTYAKH